MTTAMFFEVLAKDQKRLTEFYTSVFGWEYVYGGANPEGERFAYVNQTSNGGIRGGIGNVPASGSGIATFYVGVETKDDVEAAVKRAKKAGGKITLEPKTLDDYTFGEFADPEGNIVGVVGPFPQSIAPPSGSGDVS